MEFNSYFRKLNRLCSWTGRIITCKFRCLPDFIIIGAQKCGTTSLYNYLMQHPKIKPAFKKEVHFFDLNFNKGINWYKAHFPINCINITKDFITGEASPYYIFHPLVPQRVFETIPNVKLIVLLRNPVDRAYSHYHHEKRKLRELLNFEKAIEVEKERLGGELVKIINNKGYYSYNQQRYSYLARGVYITQIKKWHTFFPRKQILVLKSEDFYANPSKVTRDVFRFLGVEDMEIIISKKYNTGSYADMDKDTREYLMEYFRPYNEELYSFLGMDFKWNGY